MKPYFEMFAGYNRWANERLYEAAAGVPEREYRAARGAFFGSLHGTMNHLLLADRIWMRRFTGEGPTYTRLDDILHDDLPALAAARRDEDERIIAYIDALAEADLSAPMSYRTIVSPQQITQTRSSALAHFFNHQTHHRGQAHCLVTEIAGNDAMPSLDLLVFQRQTGLGTA
jgi:uncharacterized damage-inducible protein DinB